jgi:SAM-dependent methyltransferase
MTTMPFRGDSFDVAVCFWSAFNELLRTDEQEAALGEAARVVRLGGRALFDGPVYRSPSGTELQVGLRRGVGGREDWTAVEGRANPHFLHNEETWSPRADHAGLPAPSVTARMFGGRVRQVVTFQF